jgi:type III pantothenate kinase
VNLCIDIGNTAIKYGVFDQDQLVEHGHSMESLRKVDAGKITKAILSSVANSEIVLAWLNEQQIDFQPLSAVEHMPFTSVYTTPETLGSDRKAAVAGALKKFPSQNSLVITAGSCLTYNLVNRKNEFLGGAISPGINMRLKALHQFTAQLPIVAIQAAPAVQWIGGNTVESIQVGVYRAVLNEIEGFIGQFQADFENLNILICGGDAPFLVSHLKNNIFAHPSLILEGLNYILQLNANKLS